VAILSSEGELSEFLIIYEGKLQPWISGDPALQDHCKEILETLDSLMIENYFCCLQVEGSLAKSDGRPVLVPDIIEFVASEEVEGMDINDFNS